MQTRRGQCPCSGAPGQLEKKTRGQGHAVSVRVRDFGRHSIDVVTVTFARMACARQQLWQASAGLQISQDRAPEPGGRFITRDLKLALLWMGGCDAVMRAHACC